MQYTHVLNGRYAGWYPDGHKKYDVIYVHGKREGLSQLYFPDGKLAGQVHYQNDLRHGMYLKWHRNGTLAKEVRYVFGKKEGMCRLWDDTGRYIGSQFYVDDKEVTSPPAPTS